MRHLRSDEGTNCIHVKRFIKHSLGGPNPSIPYHHELISCSFYLRLVDPNPVLSYLEEEDDDPGDRELPSPES